MTDEPMVSNESILIDLKKYGGEGFLEMMYPPYSRVAEMDNVIAGIVIKVDDKGNVVRDMTGKADAILLKTLCYVESGPFERTKESFFKYTDKLDAVRRGNGERLYKEMLEAIAKIDNGDTSPSADSPGAESGSSA